MTVFIVIGAIGLAIVGVSLVVGEVFDGVFDFDAGSGLFSAPVIGAFLAAFGFGAALTMSSADIGAFGGSLAGLASGIVVGGLAWFMVRSLLQMPTENPVRTTDLEGKTAMVITRIPEGGMGEVSITHQGHLMKLYARASEPIDAGAPVHIEAVTSSSSVFVKRADGSG